MSLLANETLSLKTTFIKESISKQSIILPYVYSIASMSCKYIFYIENKKECGQSYKFSLMMKCSKYQLGKMSIKCIYCKKKGLWVGNIWKITIFLFKVIIVKSLIESFKNSNN